MTVPLFAPLFVQTVWMTENCRASCEICTPFAGDLSLAGYQRSPDYLSLVERERLGVWDVPYVFSSILFNKSALKVLSQVHFTVVALLWFTFCALLLLC